MKRLFQQKEIAWEFSKGFQEKQEEIEKQFLQKIQELKSIPKEDESKISIQECGTFKRINCLSGNYNSPSLFKMILILLGFK